MKKTLTLSEDDIKAVVAEKFKVSTDDVTIMVIEDEEYPELPGYNVEIYVESEIQNYDL